MDMTSYGCDVCGYYVPVISTNSGFLCEACIESKAETYKIILDEATSSAGIFDKPEVMKTLDHLGVSYEKFCSDLSLKLGIVPPLKIHRPKVG